MILPQIDEEPIFLSTFTFDQNGISSLINPHDQSFIPIGDDSDFAAAILMSFIHEGLSKPSQSLAVVELSRVDK